MTFDTDFDFGFSAVDPSLEVDAAKNKAEELFAAIQPLLTNLKKNPEKDHIFWPNRLEKVTEFEEKLRKILDE